MRFGIGSYTLDEERFELTLDGQPVPVQPKVLRLLLLLVRQRERSVSKQEILAALWPGESVGETSLTTAVRQARRALGDGGDAQRSIRTVRGFGYAFAALVEVLPATPGLAHVSIPLQPFVGRERVLSVLSLALEDALAGRPRTALLEGEAGIGKTRTAEEIAARARACGAGVFYGRCLETEGAPAYWPWIQIVRALVETRPARALEGWLGPSADALAQLIPELAERLRTSKAPAALGAADARFRLFDALGILLQRASQTLPLLLVLDDLHRADEPSLQLLRFLVGHAGDSSLLLLGTHREIAAARDPARARLLSEISRAPGAHALRLEGFTTDEIARFVEASIGHPGSPRWIARLEDQTGGNPFFLTHLLRLLEAEGELEQADPAELAERALPRGAREAVRRQLDGLSPRCLATLELASVAGRDFALAELAAAGELGVEEVLEALGEALVARIVAQMPDKVAHYRFAHALVRDALYLELAPERRAGLHRRLGAALETLHAQDLEPHLAALAHHFFEAAPTGVAARAIDYAVRAAERAAAQLGFEEAARHYERALQAAEVASPGMRRRCELLVARGEVEMRAGEVVMRGEPSTAARDTLRRGVELARRLGAADLLARAALAFGGSSVGMRFGVLDPELVGLLEEALAGLGSGQEALRVRLMGRLAVALYWSDERERRDSLSREAIETARRLGDGPALAYALHSRRAALWGPDGLEERLACADEMIPLARRAGQRELEIAGCQGLVADSFERGDLRRADAEAARYGAVAQELRVPQYLWWWTSYRAMRALFAGRFQEGEELAQEAMALGRSAESEDALQALGAQLFTVRREQGRLAELEPLLRGFVERYPTVPGWRTGLTFLYAELGRAAEAREHFEVVAAPGFEALPRDQNWMPALASLTEACCFLGDVERAARLYALLLPYRERLVLLGFANGCMGSVERYLGLLAEIVGRPEEAIGHHEAARATLGRLGARPWLARSSYDLARALESSGQADRAGAAAADAAEAACALGMVSLAERSLDLRRRLSGAPALGARSRG